MRSQEVILIFRILSLNFIVPVIVYWYLTNYTSTTTLMAIIYSGIPPFCDALLHVVMEWKIDAINCIVLIGTAVGVTFAILTDSPQLLLLKDSVVTSLFGFGFLVSLFFKENLIWWYNRTFNGVTPEQKAKLDAEWANPIIRTATVVLCYVWGFGYLSEAVIRILLLYTININTMVYLSIMAPFVFTGILGTWSYFYARIIRKRLAEDDSTSEEVTLTEIQIMEGK